VLERDPLGVRRQALGVLLHALRLTPYGFLLVILLAGTAEAQTLSDYTAVPPFLKNQASPDILFIVDNSGSMQCPAYDSDFDEDGTANSADTTPGAENDGVAANDFNPSTTYYGYFDSTKTYIYQSSGTERFEEQTCTITTGGTCWSGNFLNWLTMRRVDVVKKVLTGGQTKNDGSANEFDLIGHNTSGSSYCEQFEKRFTGATLVSPFANTVGYKMKNGEAKFEVTSTPGGGSGLGDFKVRIKNATDPQGIIQKQKSKARVGLMFFQTDNEGGKVISPISSPGANTTTIVDSIRTMEAKTATPLGEALLTAREYFKQATQPYHTSDYTIGVGTSADPFWFTELSPAQFVKCCQANVVLLTDGQPCNDLTIVNPLLDSLVQVNDCGGVLAGAGKLDDIAFTAHTTDLRSDAALTGTQVINLYTVGMFGQGGALLKSAAAYGGFDRSQGATAPSPTPPTTSAGFPFQVGTVKNWDANADGQPDNYFDAQDGDQLANALDTITSKITEATSGTGATVASNTSGAGLSTQALFFPTMDDRSGTGTVIKWAGSLQAFFVDAFGNLREDNGSDARLVLKNSDRIMRIVQDVTTRQLNAQLFADVDGNGQADSSTPVSTVPIADAPALWDAGKRLALTDPQSRRILLWADGTGGGTFDGIVQSGERIALTKGSAYVSTDADVVALQPYVCWKTGCTATETASILNYIRGQAVTNWRNRNVTVSGQVKPWKLGDIVNSTPQVVGAPAERFDVIYGDSTYQTFFKRYKNRRTVAYVGANDGMLHAFNSGFANQGDDTGTTNQEEALFFTNSATPNGRGASLGDELFGFIPHELLPHLAWLTCETTGGASACAGSAYNHVYYVDLKPRVTDMRIFTAEAACGSDPTSSGCIHPNGWGTVLIIGMRLGGGSITVSIGGTKRTFRSAYVVLDITNPEDDGASGSYGKILFSFNDSANALTVNKNPMDFSGTGLGFTTSYPAVVRIANSQADKKGNATWFLAFGTGPDKFDYTSTLTGQLMVIKTSDCLTTACLPQRFDPKPNNEDGYTGDVLAVDVDLEYQVDALYFGQICFTNPSEKCSKTDATRFRGDFFRVTTANALTPSSWGISNPPGRAGSKVFEPGVGKPILARPSATMDNAGIFWVFFGTGKFVTLTDVTTSTQQSFYGIKDPCWNASCQTTFTDIWNDVDTTKVFTDSTVSSSPTGAATFGTLLVQMGNKQGWSLKLTCPKNPFAASDDETVLAQSEDVTTCRERAISQPVILGGMLLFSTFNPNGDTCDPSGFGRLYALSYNTGTAYKETSVGTFSEAGKTRTKSMISMGQGVPSSPSVHVGAQGSGASGDVASDGGCQSRLSVVSQSSSGGVTRVCGQTAGVTWSKFLTWRDARGL